MLEIGIDSFAAINKENYQEKEHPGEKAMDELLERIVACDQLGFDVFGIGEHQGFIMLKNLISKKNKKNNRL